MYIDESWDRHDEYVVLSGLIIPVNVWKNFETKIRRIKEDFFDTPNFNLKAVRRNKHDKDKTWEKLLDDKKKEFNEKFYEIIKESDITIISALIEKKKMEDPKNKELFFYLAYGFIIQRYQYFLQENKTHGIIVMDQAKNEEIKNLFFVHRGFLKDGVPFRRKDLLLRIGNREIELKDYERHSLNNILENLIFMNDEYSNCLQVVDMICAAISGKFNRNIDIFFNKIEGKIRKSKDGKMQGYGLKIFP